MFNRIISHLIVFFPSFAKRFDTLLIFLNNFMNKFGFYRYAIRYYYGAHIYCIVGFKLFISFLGVTPAYFSKHHLPVFKAVYNLFFFDILPEINPNFWFCKYRDTVDLNSVILDLLPLDLNMFSAEIFKYFLIFFCR